MVNGLIMRYARKKHQRVLTCTSEEKGDWSISQRRLREDEAFASSCPLGSGIPEPLGHPHILPYVKERTNVLLRRRTPNRILTM